jgi:hypothetical protein
MGLNPAKGNGFLKVINIRSMPSLGGEVKLKPHVARFYSMLKPFKLSKRYFITQNSSFPSPIPPACYR